MNICLISGDYFKFLLLFLDLFCFVIISKKIINLNQLGLIYILNLLIIFINIILRANKHYIKIGFIKFGFM